MDDDSPDDVALRTLTRQLFPDHGLGRDTAGDRDTVRSITADDIRRFHGDHYTTGSTVVAVAGEIDHDDIVDAVVDRLRRPARGRRAGASPAPRRASATASPSTTTPSRSTSPSVAARCAATTLIARFSTSSTTSSAAGCRAACSTRSASVAGSPTASTRRPSSYADVGAWSVYAGSMPEHAGEVERLIHSEIERLVSGGITAEELDVAVGYLTGAYQLGLEDTAARMSRLGGMLITLGKVHSVEEQLARWENVTLDDAKRVIADVFGAAAPVTVTVGPRSDSTSTDDGAQDGPVAVIGTGVIGGGMAVNLLRNGHEVAVWNRTAEHAAERRRRRCDVGGDPCRCGSRRRRRVRGDSRRRLVAIGVARRRRHHRRFGGVGDARHVGDAVAGLGRRARRRLPRRRAGRSSTCRSPAAAPAPRAARSIMLAGGDAAALASIADVLDAVSSTRPALRSRRQRNAVQARAQRSAGDPPRRLRRGDGDGPCRRTRSRRGRPGARRSARRAGHARWPGRADQQLPERANFALALGAQGPALRVGDGRRRADADARRRGGRDSPPPRPTGLGDRDWTVVAAAPPTSDAP